MSIIFMKTININIHRIWVFFFQFKIACGENVPNYGFNHGGAHYFSRSKIKFLYLVGKIRNNNKNNNTKGRTNEFIFINHGDIRI